MLKSRGWDIDKEGCDVGWIVTDSRRLDGDKEKRILDEIGRSL